MVISSDSFAAAVKEAAKKKKARRKKELPAILKQFEDRIQEELSGEIGSLPQEGSPVELCFKDPDKLVDLWSADVKDALRSRLAQAGWEVSSKIYKEERTYREEVFVDGDFKTVERKDTVFGPHVLVLTLTPLSRKEK